MSDDLVRGSGNVYRDFGDPNAELRQLKAILAAAIVKTLDRDKLSVRDAEKLTGVPYAEFSRIRHAKIASMTIDKLMTILDKLGQDVRIKVDVQPRSGAAMQERLL